MTTSYLLDRPARSITPLNRLGDAVLCVALAAFSRTANCPLDEMGWRSFLSEVDAGEWGPVCMLVSWSFSVYASKREGERIRREMADVCVELVDYEQYRKDRQVKP